MNHAPLILSSTRGQDKDSLTEDITWRGSVAPAPMADSQDRLDIPPDRRRGGVSAYSGTGHPMHVSRPYSSPISGILTLTDVGKDDTANDEAGETEQESGLDDEDDHVDEEESTNLNSLGLQVGPFCLPREQSTTTLKNVAGRNSDENGEDTFTWDASESEGQRDTTTGSPASLSPASLSPAQSIPIGIPSQQSSSTWSIASKAAKVVSGALQNGQVVDAELSPSLSCSLPNPTVLSRQRKVVSESWDEDFLFQDEEESERNDSPRASLGSSGNKDESPSKWDEMDDEEEDWNTPLGDLKVTVPEPTSSKATHTEQSSRLNDADHLERRDNDWLARPGPSRARPASVQVMAPKRTASKQASMPRRPISAVAQRVNSANAFELKRGPAPATSASSSRQSIEDMRSAGSGAAKQSAVQDGIRQYVWADNGQQQQIPALPRSPSKRVSRTIEGHWSQFVSTKLGYSKSPDTKRQTKSGETSEVDATNASRMFPGSQNSPSLYPSPHPARNSALNRDLPENGNVVGADVSPSRVEQRPRPLRKVNGSLSMSFGLPSVWSRASQPTSKVGQVGRTLSAASSSSVSLASVVADAGRPEADEVGPSSFSSTANEMQRMPVMEKRRTVGSKSSSSTISSSQFNSQVDSRGSKRKLSAADGHAPASIASRALDEVEMMDTVRTLRNVPRTTVVSARSPSSQREPLPMTSRRSNSGSTMTVTSAVVSSDYTSGGSMTEESTLYGSTGDGPSTPSTYFGEYGPYSRRTSSITSIPSEPVLALRDSGKSVRHVPSARRIRVATAGSQLAKNGPKVEPVADIVVRSRVQSASERQVRVPSAPASAIVTGSNGRTREGKTVRGKHGSESASTDSFSRRNSLGDLKIPSRITKAQEGIRANMSRVRDFALGIEELKELRRRYQEQLARYHASDLRRLHVEEVFGSWWECAEVLISLGEGRGREDDEADVTSLQHSTPLRPGSSPSARRQADRSARKATSSAATEYGQSTVTRSTGSGSGSRPASSRASSSRSVDPQREMDILAAMLTGIPLDDLSPGRSDRSSRERALSATAVPPMLSMSPPASNTVRRTDPQGQLEMAATSTTSLTFAEAPAYTRNRSHRNSPSIHRTGLYHVSEGRAPYQGSTSSFATAGLSSESVNTQGDLGRSRLRKSGKTGLQGLRELLRTFKMNSTVRLKGSEASQSRLSLARTLTNDSRLTLEDGTENPDVRPKRLSRTRSLFAKSTNQSPSSQHVTLPTGLGDEPLVSPYSDRQRNLIPCDDRLPGHDRKTSKASRQSSGAGSSTLDSSLDSDWTQGDFDQNDASPKSRTDAALHLLEGPPAPPTSSRKRFFLFSKGFPPSAAKRHSREVVNWVHNASTDSVLSSLRRPSLQLSPYEVVQTSPPGMPGTTSSARHPLLMSDERRGSVPETGRRSSSTASSSALPSSTLLFAGHQAAADRPSVGSTIVAVNNSSASGSAASAASSADLRRRHTEEPGAVSTRASLSSPRRFNSHDTSGSFRKLALKPEAIPSLLVYLDSTKARCQDSLALLSEAPA